MIPAMNAPLIVCAVVPTKQLSGLIIAKRNRFTTAKGEMVLLVLVYQEGMVREHNKKGRAVEPRLTISNLKKI
jgi:hypothetical protein